jgi:hypothetical protein
LNGQNAKGLLNNQQASFLKYTTLRVGYVNHGL